VTTRLEAFRTTRLEKLRRLINDFDEITALPSATGGKDPVADARMESMLALKAVALFMQSVPELTGKEAPLVALLSALQDVHDGRNPKMFKKPNRKRGKPKPELSIVFPRARAAVAMTFLMRADPGRSDQNKAAQRVANGCGRWFGRRPSAGQVKRWRAALLGDADDSDGRRYYRETIASLEIQFPDPEQAAQYLLST